MNYPRLLLVAVGKTQILKARLLRYDSNIGGKAVDFFKESGYSWKKLNIHKMKKMKYWYIRVV